MDRHENRSGMWSSEEDEAEWMRRPAAERARYSHALLVSSLKQWEEQSAANTASGRLSAAEPFWRRMVRYGVLLQYDELFWENWRACCEQRYQTPVTQEQVTGVRLRLRQFLETKLPPLSLPGLALRRELAAAEALKRWGGFPVLEEGDVSLVCGPDMIRRLGYEREFAAFVASRIELAACDAPDQTRSLYRAFSQLGDAQTLLVSGYPQAALQALEQYCCARCASLPVASDGMPRVCMADCPDFAFHNPAYAALEDGEYRLRREAAELTIEARLAVAVSNISAESMQLEQAETQWKEALRLARLANVETRICRSLVETVLGRTKALAARNSLDEAIALLDTVVSLCPEPFLYEITGIFADILQRRGVERINREEPDREGAIADLRRSVTLNPSIPRMRRNLIVALQQTAAAAAEQDATVGDSERMIAARRLVEARQVLEEGRRMFPHHEDMAELILPLENQIEWMAERLCACGIEQEKAKKFDRAVELLEVAYELVSAVSEFQETLCRVTAGFICDLVLQQQMEQAREKYVQARKRFPDDWALRQLDVLFMDLGQGTTV